MDPDHSRRTDMAGAIIKILRSPFWLTDALKTPFQVGVLAVGIKKARLCAQRR